MSVLSVNDIFWRKFSLMFRGNIDISFFITIITHALF